MILVQPKGADIIWLSMDFRGDLTSSSHVRKALLLCAVTLSHKHYFIQAAFSRILLCSRSGTSTLIFFVHSPRTICTPTRSGGASLDMLGVHA